jgi:hypothetical protein
MEALNNTLTYKVFRVSILISSIMLALAYVLNGFFLLAGLFLILGTMWLLDNRRRRHHLPSLVLIVFTLFCILGYWLQLSMPVLVLALSAAIAAWDMDHFIQRIQAQPPLREFDRLQRHHIKQLVIVIGIGIVIAQTVLLIQITLNFWIIFVIALLVTVSLTRVLMMIRSGS